MTTPHRSASANSIIADKASSSIQRIKPQRQALDIPIDFICPLSSCVMVHPCITPSGFSFERSAILEWLKTSSVCPVGFQPLSPEDLLENHRLQVRIAIWKQSKGIPEHKKISAKHHNIRYGNQILSPHSHPKKLGATSSPTNNKHEYEALAVSPRQKSKRRSMGHESRSKSEGSGLTVVVGESKKESNGSSSLLSQFKALNLSPPKGSVRKKPSHGKRTGRIAFAA